MDSGFDGGMDFGGPGGLTPRGQGGAADAAAGGTKPSTANDGIPHFSEVVGMSPPPGFGGALAVSTTVTTIGSTASSSGGASASSSGSSGTPSSTQVDEKTRSFAQAKMKQFDKNNNGQLEKEEWSQMNDGEKYDLNKDGAVSLDEMTQYLSRPLGSDDSVDTSKPKSPSKPTSAGGRPGRFRSVAERFPDLSAKFFQLDRDGDGQIEMWEFSANWTEQTVREFQKYDINGDGIITPEEWLKVEPKSR
jgi:Ca2+-binding EF-hand superfamily protein